MKRLNSREHDDGSMSVLCGEVSRISAFRKKIERERKTQLPYMQLCVVLLLHNGCC